MMITNNGITHALFPRVFFLFGIIIPRRNGASSVRRSANKSNKIQPSGFRTPSSLHLLEHPPRTLSTHSAPSKSHLTELSHRLLDILHRRASILPKQHLLSSAPHVSSTRRHGHRDRVLIHPVRDHVRVRFRLEYGRLCGFKLLHSPVSVVTKRHRHVVGTTAHGVVFVRRQSSVVRHPSFSARYR